MVELAERIARLNAIDGPLSVAQFMTFAMHDRERGYYATRDPLGAGGDFVTAPEISQMFGELLGLWCAQVWEDQGCPRPARLVELGPGRGTLMRDALRALRAAPAFLEAIDVVLIDSNPKLAGLQREMLKAQSVPVAWDVAFSPKLADRPVFALANEFVDALPVRQFVRMSDGWHERMVGLDPAGGLAFVLSPVAADDALPITHAGAPVGSLCETSAAAQGLAAMLAQSVRQAGGAALVIDYGYDAPEFTSTLQATSRHRSESPLAQPGDADLSAHVDFAAFAAAARAEDAQVYGPVEQGEFLLAVGIEIRAERLSHTSTGPRSIALDLDRLTAADKMGGLFKALAILPPGTPRPPGF
jgi:SAM-dependent MidA family methyltransferase